MPAEEGAITNRCKVDAYLDLVDDQEVAEDLDELLFYEAACCCEECTCVPSPYETAEEAFAA